MADVLPPKDDNVADPIDPASAATQAWNEMSDAERRQLFCGLYVFLAIDRPMELLSLEFNVRLQLWRE